MMGGSTEQEMLLLLLLLQDAAVVRDRPQRRRLVGYRLTDTLLAPRRTVCKQT